MKKVLLISALTIGLFSCKKDETTNEPSRCMHCVQVQIDVATGTELSRRDGGESTTYCDGVLDIVLNQHPGNTNDTIVFNTNDTSVAQRYMWICN